MRPGFGATFAYPFATIGIAWANGDQKGGFVVQCDKNQYRGMLMALEGITGKKSIDSEAMTVKN